MPDGTMVISGTSCKTQASPRFVSMPGAEEISGFSMMAHIFSTSDDRETLQSFIDLLLVALGVSSLKHSESQAVLFVAVALRPCGKNAQKARRSRGKMHLTNRGLD
ncbi:unnamed protein product [Polarella glacialis]|uniref:Uncharacterized protein n=1 Tax=Polarella glacialis TaxID=89957 RepID=A0A813E1L5_POLGL|nr:unnamed protein product [Polarella glacialis]